uniref:Cell adhesion molecule 3 n=1 Tax=Neolamprologus brichardi TaxID=32507 RepID=A0A3Q4HGG8_NEOBR
MTSDETVPVGGTVTLTCRVAESDNSSLQWSNTAQQTLYFGEKRALRDNRIQLYRSTSTELSITISEVQLSDEGEYTCSIFTMPVRTARATVTVLGVPGKPQISGFEHAVKEEEKVTLTCTSTGSKPPATLHWYKGDQLLKGERYGQCVSELTLEVSASDDNTLITCAVNHPSLSPGDKRSEQALRVLCKSTGKLGGKEGLSFSLSARPTIYTWDKKDGGLPLQAKPDGAVLHFSMLNKSDNGVYVCHADNGIGIFSAPLFLSFRSVFSLSLSPLFSLSLSLFLPPFIIRFHQYSSTPSSPPLFSISVSLSCSPLISRCFYLIFSCFFSLFLYHAFSFFSPSPPFFSFLPHWVVAVIVFILLCLLIVLGRYLIRHKGTYLTHEAKGSDDAPDADTAIINAEGGHSGAEDKKEYFI